VNIPYLIFITLQLITSMLREMRMREVHTYPSTLN